ncbi:MAG: hypothetical protein VKO64_05200 [Candidatus Sericytochromatia bacterium]|nr:hypothetical protein [Candidatus Sericytochromatia bacterium]
MRDIKSSATGPISFPGVRKPTPDLEDVIGQRPTPDLPVKDLPGVRPSLDSFQFRIRDKNADGVLSGNETKGIEQKDANGDGKITYAEYRGAATNEIKDLAELGRKLKFRSLDENKDGVLTGTEATGLRRLDKDGDGRITEKEYLKGLAAEDRDKQELKHDKEFKSLDINEDDVLSGTEARNLGAFDADKDGKVTRQEYLDGRANGIKPPLGGLFGGGNNKPLLPRPGFILPLEEFRRLLPFNPVGTLGLEAIERLRASKRDGLLSLEDAQANSRPGGPSRPGVADQAIQG